MAGSLSPEQTGVPTAWFTPRLSSPNRPLSSKQTLSKNLPVKASMEPRVLVGGRCLDADDACSDGQADATTLNLN